MQPTSRMARLALESTMLDLHVALPGAVRSYDAETQTAEIEIGIQRVLPAESEDDAEDTPETLPILQSVPVAWPRGGGCFLHWPLAAGDTGLIVFAESDLNQWRASGGVVDPGIATRHGLSGGVFFPGLHTRPDPNGSASGDHGRVGKEGGPYVEFNGSQIRAGGAATLAKRDQLATHLQAIKAALDTIAAAAGAANSYNFTILDGADPIATSILRGE